MKKQYRLLIEDVFEESDEDSSEIWLETEDGTILLPAEIAKYLDLYGIMGIT